MKAISLWQPWATLIAAGMKPYETRHWAPPRELIGQNIAIHAAKKCTREIGEFVDDLVYGQNLGDRLAATFDRAADDHLGVFGHAALPAGCVVCIAKLDAAFQLGEPMDGTASPAARVERRLVSRSFPDCFTVRYDEYGDYAPGRWAWLLTNIQPLRRPVKATGQQGFFDLPQGWLVS